jgi:hypothetical protein
LVYGIVFVGIRGRFKPRNNTTNNPAAGGQFFKGFLAQIHPHNSHLSAAKALSKKLQPFSGPGVLVLTCDEEPLP